MTPPKKPPVRTPVPKVKKPAKRPPTKKPSTFGVRPRTRATEITGVTEDEVPGAAWLRYAAGSEYITNFAGLSIRELAKRSPFDQVSPASLTRWAVEDEWVRRRQQYFQTITHEAEKRLQEKLIRARVDQLSKMEDIAIQMADEILSGIVQAKSKEGMVTALVRLLESSEAMREKLAAQVVPAYLGGVQQETLPLTPHLSNEETRAAVTAVLQQRRLQTRQRIAADAQAKNKAESEGNPEKKPRLLMVRGCGDV